MKQLFVLGFALFLIAGCTTAGRKMHRMAPGMEKKEVIAVLGWPRSTEESGNVEVLHYKEGLSRFEYYFVRLVDGKVESFGPETKNDRVSPSDPPLKP